MKNKIAIASAFLAAASFSSAEIVINDFLSFEGFIDMSYTNSNNEFDAAGAPTLDESENSFAIDQVEISWLFDFDPVTAQIDLEYEEGGDSDLEVEQAFVTYHFDGDSEGSAITAGRYASMLGFEAFEPTGLYQFSTAYGLSSLSSIVDGIFGAGIADDGLALIESTIFPVGARYSQGVKYTYEDDNSFFGISLQDGTASYDGRLGGDNSSDGTSDDGGGYGLEIAYAYDFDNGFAFFLGGSYEDGDGFDTTSIDTGDTEAWVINSYVTYETGAWLFAAEVNYGESEWDDVVGLGDFESESLSGLIMANYAYSDQASVTGRVSYVDYEAEVGAGDLDGEAFKYTVAHNYAFTDNLLLVAELSYTDGDVDADTGDSDFEELLSAVELIFSF